MNILSSHGLSMSAYQKSIKMRFTQGGQVNICLDQKSGVRADVKTRHNKFIIQEDQFYIINFGEIIGNCNNKVNDKHAKKVFRVGNMNVHARIKKINFEGVQLSVLCRRRSNFSRYPSSRIAKHAVQVDQFSRKKFHRIASNYSKPPYIFTNYSRR